MYRDLLGVKFKPHGRTVKEGLDCIGVLLEVFKRDGIKLIDPWYDSLDVLSDEDFWRKFNNQFKKIERPVEKCVVEIFSHYSKKGHVAVYIGNGMIIHTTVRTGVCIEPLSRYEHKIEGYYSVSN